MKTLKTLFSLVLFVLCSTSMTFAQDTLMVEGFSNDSDGDGWVFDNVWAGSGNDQGLFDGNKAIKLKPTESSITTPTFTMAGDFSFYYKVKDANSEGGILNVQESIDGGTSWDEVLSIDITESTPLAEYQKVTCSIGEASAMIKVLYTVVNTEGSLYVDDFSLTQMPIPEGDVTLDTIKIDGVALPATLNQFSHEYNLFYRDSVVVEGVALDPAASVSVVQPTDILSDDVADRTAIISITAANGSKAGAYNVVINVSPDLNYYNPFGDMDYVKTQNLVTEGTYTFSVASPLPTQETKAICFTNPGYIVVPASDSAKQLSFRAAQRRFTAGEDLNVEIYQFVEGETDSTLIETISNLNSGLSTTAWKQFSIDITTTGSTYFKFIFSPDADFDSRMAFDDITVARVQLAQGINDKMATSVSIYPNPATDQLTIAGVTGDFSVEIYSLQGALISTSYNSNTISLDAMSTGSYLVKINESSNSYVERLLVK